MSHNYKNRFANLNEKKLHIVTHNIVSQDAKTPIYDMGEVWDYECSDGTIKEVMIAGNGLRSAGKENESIWVFALEGAGNSRVRTSKLTRRTDFARYSELDVLKIFSTWVNELDHEDAAWWLATYFEGRDYEISLYYYIISFRLWVVQDGEDYEPKESALARVVADYSDYLPENILNQFEEFSKHVLITGGWGNVLPLANKALEKYTHALSPK